MKWIDELNPEEIFTILTNDGKDMALVIQECGMDIAKVLWEKMASLNIYVSEKSLFAMKRLYIRKHYNAAEPHSKKLLAVRLHVSEEFVKKALATTDEHDDIQGKLL